MRQTQAILIEMTMKIKFRKQYKVQMLLEKRLSMVEDPGGLWSVLWARAVSESLMTGWSGKTSLPWRGRIKTFAISGGVIVVWIGGNEL